MKQRLKYGEVLLGTWSVLPAPTAAEVMVSAGLDFLIIDMEHGPVGFETAGEMMRGVKIAGGHSLVRFGRSDAEAVLKALDLGTQGILVAHVETAQDAHTVVSLAKYPPIGVRGFSPYTRAGGYGGLTMESHTVLQNQETLVGIIVEGEEGLENLDSILATPYLDLVYIGAYDLSQALGMPGQVRHPRIRQCLETCVRTIRNAGVAAGGSVAKDKDDLCWMIDVGMQFITLLPDVTQLFNACRGLVQDFQTILEKKGRRP